MKQVGTYIYSLVLENSRLKGENEGENVSNNANHWTLKFGAERDMIHIATPQVVTRISLDSCIWKT